MSDRLPQPETRRFYLQQIVSLFNRAVPRVLLAFLVAFLILFTLPKIEINLKRDTSCRNANSELLCQIEKSNFLGLIESFSIIVVAILFILESSDRKKQKLYQLWNLIDGAGTTETSYARYQALQELKQEKVALKGLDAVGADLDGIDLEGANLEEATLQKVKLNRANLRRANFQEANLQEANLRETDLQGANLRLADLEKANLQKANLHGANLGAANLKQAFLYKANLHGANLEGACLRGAMLQGANLQDAELSGAELQGIDDLSLSQVKAAKNWDKAKYDNNFHPEIELNREGTAHTDEFLEQPIGSKVNTDTLLKLMILFLKLNTNDYENKKQFIEEKTPDLLEGDLSALQEVRTLFKNLIERDKNIRLEEENVIRNVADLEDNISSLRAARSGKKADREAAEWLATKQELLKSVGGDAALKKNPEIKAPGGFADSPEKVEQFYRDIDNYLSVIHYYLSQSKKPQPLYEGAIKLALPIPIYLDAFTFIIEQVIPDLLSSDSDKLSMEGLNRLNFYLNDCLIKSLRQLDKTQN